MKNVLKVLSVLLVLMAGVSAFGQSNLSKAEKKALKKELKSYRKDVDTYSKMKADHEEAIRNLQRNLDSLNNELFLQGTRFDSLIQVNRQAERDLEDLREAAVNCGKVPLEGTVYSVQIGNYKKLDVSAYFVPNKGLRTENYTGGNAYMIGNFQSVDEAMEFAKVIRRLGITDTFVTKYVDGERIIDFDATTGK